MFEHAISQGGFIAIACGIAIVAYFMGNISPSTLMAKARGIDIKAEGSGNAGTTNALRVLGKKAGAITLVVDVLKGTLAVLIGSLIAGNIGAAVAAVAVFAGHVWPIVYRFRGGKGVATLFGATLGLNPFMALIALCVVVVVVLITKRMSAGSLTGAIIYPFLALWLEPEFFWASVAAAVIVLIKHRGNIIRLCRGEEPLMSIFAKKDKTAEPQGDTSDKSIKKEDL